MEWLSIVSDVSVTAGVLIAALTYAFSRRRAATGDLLTAVNGMRDEVRRDVDAMRDEMRRNMDELRDGLHDLRENVDELRRDVNGIDKRLAVVEARFEERAASRPMVAASTSAEPEPDA